MNICILGAGGLGSVLGGWLADAGVDVTLVARPAHVDAIREHGLRITGFRGEATVGPEHLTAVTHPDEVTGEVDYLILLVKAKDTEQALADAASLRDRTGVAFSLQNTVCKEEQLAEWIGADRVIGATTTEAGVLVEPGAVRYVATAPTSCYFGEVGGGSSPRVDALVDAFQRAGFGSKAAADVEHVEWEKLLQISTVAAFTVTTFGAYGGSMAEGLAVREAAEHYTQLATELFAVYRALGYEPQDFFAPFSRFREFEGSTFDESVVAAMDLGRHMREQGFVGRPSLHDDLLRGRTTEVDYSLGAYLGGGRRTRRRRPDRPGRVPRREVARVLARHVPAGSRCTRCRRSNRRPSSGPAEPSAPEPSRPPSPGETDARGLHRRRRPHPGRPPRRRAVDRPSRRPRRARHPGASSSAPASTRSRSTTSTSAASTTSVRRPATSPARPGSRPACPRRSRARRSTGSAGRRSRRCTSPRRPS